MQLFVTFNALCTHCDYILTSRAVTFNTLSTHCDDILTSRAVAHEVILFLQHASARVHVIHLVDVTDKQLNK